MRGQAVRTRERDRPIKTLPALIGRSRGQSAQLQRLDDGQKSL